MNIRLLGILFGYYDVAPVKPIRQGSAKFRVLPVELALLLLIQSGLGDVIYEAQSTCYASHRISVPRTFAFRTYVVS